MQREYIYRSSDGDYKLQTDAQIKQAYNRKSTEYSENKIFPFLQESDFAEGVVGRGIMKPIID